MVYAVYSGETSASGTPGKRRTSLPGLPSSEPHRTVYLMHFILNHPVSNPNLRKYILRLRRVLLQLPSDVGHIDAQNAVVIVRIRPPDIGNDGVIRHNPAGILSQEGNNFKFYLREMNLFSRQSNLVLLKINDQIPGAEGPFIQQGTGI